MKRVLFLINNLAGGGAEKVLTTYMKYLKNDYDITVQTIFNEGVYVDKIQRMVTYKSIIQKPTLLKKRIIQRLIKYLPSKLLYKIFVRDKFDCSVAFLEGLPCKIIAGAPKETQNLAWIHTDLRNYALKIRGFYSNKSENRCYSNFEKVVCVSNDVKKAFIEVVKTQEVPIVIYNPVNAKEVQRLSRGKYEGVNRPAKKGFTCVAVGRLVSLKGFDRLIEAIHRLITEGHEIYLWIIGEGEEKNKLNALICQYNLKENIVLMGFQENPYPFIREADLFVLSSHIEGYSLVIAEAFMLGVPVVSTRCSGPIELLSNGEYGVLVDNSEEGIYKGIKTVLSNEKLYKELKEKSQIRGKQLSAEQSIAEIKTLIGGEN